MSQILIKLKEQYDGLNSEVIDFLLENGINNLYAIQDLVEDEFINTCLVHYHQSHPQFILKPGERSLLKGIGREFKKLSNNEFHKSFCQNMEVQPKKRQQFSSHITLSNDTGNNSKDQSEIIRSDRPFDNDENDSQVADVLQGKGIRNKRLNCPHCPSTTFGYRGVLVKHLQKVHNICHICGIEATNINQHYEEAHKKPETRQRTNEANSPSLEVRRKSQYRNMQPKAAKVVEQRLNNRASPGLIARHQRKEHQVSLPSSAIKQPNLRHDLTGQARVKCFPCHLCRKAFTNDGYLRRHLRLKHSRSQYPENPMPSKRPSPNQNVGYPVATNNPSRSGQTDHPNEVMDTNFQYKFESGLSSGTGECSTASRNVTFDFTHCSAKFNTKEGLKFHVIELHEKNNGASTSNEPTGDPVRGTRSGIVSPRARERNIWWAHRKDSNQSDSDSESEGKSVERNRRLSQEFTVSDNFPLSKLRNSSFQFQCEHCSRRFETLRSKNIHIGHKHKRDDDADYNPKPNTIRSRRNTDSVVVSSDKPNAQQISSRRNTRAEAIITDNIENRYMCPHCSMIFFTERGLVAHKQWNHPETLENLPNNSAAEKTIPCNECPKKFSSSKALMRHRSYRHNKDGHDVRVFKKIRTNNITYKCCSERFASAASIRAHLGGSKNSIEDPKLT